MLTGEQAADYARRYGVSPEILADGTWLLTRRAFWAALIDGFVEPELEPDLDLLEDEIDATGAWPVLHLSAGLALINWRGPDEEGGYDYAALCAGRCINIAGVDGHGYGPGLSWPEAHRVITHGTVGTADQRLLLVLPALGDADIPPELPERVAAALIAVAGAAADDAALAARQLLDAPARWTRTGDTLTCDAEYAVRRPGCLPPEDLLLVTQALA